MTEQALWPDLPLSAWTDTCETLHRWTQIAGKVRLKLTPLVNHWWNVTFHVGSRGLVAPANPCPGGTFDIVFDFIDHQLRISKSDGRSESFALAPMPVADFYAQFMRLLQHLDIDVRIWTMPSEIEKAVPFDQDRTHAQYDPNSRALPPGARSIGPGHDCFSRGLHRQSKSGAFLLGQLRPRGHALLGPHRAAADERHPQRRQLGDGGSLLARSFKLRILAGQWRLWPRCVLRLRLP